LDSVPARLTLAFCLAAGGSVGDESTGLEMTCCERGSGVDADLSLTLIVSSPTASSVARTEHIMMLTERRAINLKMRTMNRTAGSTHTCLGPKDMSRSRYHKKKKTRNEFGTAMMPAAGVRLCFRCLSVVAALQAAEAFSVVHPLVKLATWDAPHSQGTWPRLRQRALRQRHVRAVSMATDTAQDFEALKQSLWNAEIQKDWESFYTTVESEGSYFADDIDGTIPEDFCATIFRNGYGIRFNTRRITNTD
jgi:hypothetical protein